MSTPSARAVSSPSRIRLRIQGRVQGVGFRFFTRETAQRAGVTGVVRNCVDGSVEAIGEGSQAALDTWVEQLRQGPALSHVTDCHIQHSTFVGEFDSFTIGR